MLYTEDKVYENRNFSEEILDGAEFINCRFINCKFVNCDLSSRTFIETEFVNCDFSMSNISNVTWSDVRFVSCKLMGLHFDNCNSLIFSLDFDRCILNFSSFYSMQLKKMNFKSCTLLDVDFAQADLTEAVFSDCDLAGASFDATNLEKTDFRTAVNYTLNPENNKVNKAKFSQAGIGGLLGKYNIEIYD